MLQIVTTQLSISTHNSDSNWVTHLFPFPVHQETPAWSLSALWLAAGEVARLWWQKFTQGQAKPGASIPSPPLCTLVSKAHSLFACKDLLFLHSLQDRIQVFTTTLPYPDHPPCFPKQPGPQSKQTTSTLKRALCPRILKPLCVCVCCALCLECLYLLLIRSPPHLYPPSFNPEDTGHRKRHIPN